MENRASKSLLEQIEQRKLYKKLKIDDNATHEEINRKILKFSKTGCKIFWYHLNEWQTSDPDFMLSFYRTNEGNMRVNFADSLATDIDFMAQYCRIKYDYKEKVYKEFGWSKPSVGHIVKELQFSNVNTRPEFYLALFKEFPDHNVCEMIDVGTSWHMNECFTKTIKQLPKDFLIEQAKKFGAEFLLYYPRRSSDYVELIDYAIECDGFKSLAYLNDEDILSNKHLIIKAFEKDGAEGLKKYFNETISLEREDCEGVYTCVHSILIQKALMEDKDFWATIKSKMSKKEQGNFSIESFVDPAIVKFLKKLSEIDGATKEKTSPAPKGNAKQNGDAKSGSTNPNASAKSGKDDRTK